MTVLEPRFDARDVTPDPLDEADIIGRAVKERRITPLQGLDLLTQAVCANLIDNAFAQQGRGS